MTNDLKIEISDFSDFFSILGCDAILGLPHYEWPNYFVNVCYR